MTENSPQNIPPISAPEPKPPALTSSALPDPAAPAAPAAPGAPGAIAAAAPATPGVALIGIEDFAKVKLVTGEVVSAVAHPKADRLLILQVKTGSGTKQIVSGIRQFYSAEQMVGKTIIVVNNLQPAKLRGENSEGMLLAVRLPEGGLRLVTTDGPAPAGLDVS